MDIKEIMSVNADNLRKKQFEALKKHTLSVLNKVSKAIEEDKFDEVTNYTSHSPAGDECGLNNDFIDFGYGDVNRGYNGALDILEITDMLKSLKK